MHTRPTSLGQLVHMELADQRTTHTYLHMRTSPKELACHDPRQLLEQLQGVFKMAPMPSQLSLLCPLALALPLAFAFCFFLLLLLAFGFGDCFGAAEGLPLGRAAASVVRMLLGWHIGHLA